MSTMFTMGRTEALRRFGLQKQAAALLEKRALGFLNSLGNTVKNMGGSFLNAAGGGSMLGHMAGMTANASRPGVGTWLGNRAMTAAKQLPRAGALGAMVR